MNSIKVKTLNRSEGYSNLSKPASINTLNPVKRQTYKSDNLQLIKKEPQNPFQTPTKIKSSLTVNITKADLKSVNINNQNVEPSNTKVKKPIVERLKEGVKTEHILQGASAVSDGLSFVYDSLEEADTEDIAPDFLKFTSIAFRLATKPGAMKQNYDKGDYYSVGRDSVATVKGLWGATLSGMKTVSTTASLGAKMKFIEPATALSVSSKATAVTKFANKVVLPFSVASTGIYFWDLLKTNSELSDKKENLKTEENQSEKIKLTQEINDLKNDRKFKFASFTLSAISTGANVVSLVRPEVSKVSNAVAIGTNVAATIVRVFSKAKVRNDISNNYKKLNNNYDSARTYFNKEIIPTIYLQKKLVSLKKPKLS